MVSDGIRLFRNSWHRRSPGQGRQKAKNHNHSESRPKDRGQAADPRKALILVFILWFVVRISFSLLASLPPNSFELSQGNLLSLNVKSWPEN